MSRCYLCGTLLNESNRSVEHIIPNAIGGNLKSKDLICKDCNSNTGLNIDSELSRQLNFIANMLNIERDRGKPQEFKVKNESTGEIYRCLLGGIPSRIKPEIIQDNNQIKIKAPNEKIARQLLNQIKSQNPNLEIDQVINKAEKSREYINNWCKFNVPIGGADAFKSIYKTAISFYIYSGGSSHYITNIKQIISDEMMIFNYVKPCYLDYEIVEKDSEEVLHSILIKGNKETGKLYCYIEYFSAFKYAILLNNNYNGEDINKLYIFNVLNRQEILERNVLPTWFSDINNIFNSLEWNQILLKDSLENLMKIISDKQHNNHLNRLICEAWEDTIKTMELLEGDEITKEVYDVLIKNTIDAVMPYLERFIPKE
ncbi:HNH endonuclease [Veillonella parvula]|uniref:HNH endonuclease n=1 Tax=Veillonella parvula TaxID=29466 RepID=UPI0028D7568D|nr:HNH endonuclease [Veillonella parvula]